MQPAPRKTVDNKWYHKIWLVSLLVVFLPPVGFYGLYKMDNWPASVRWIILVAYLGIMVAASKEPSISDKQSLSSESYPKGVSPEKTIDVNRDSSHTDVDSIFANLSNWVYNEYIDRMTSKKRYVALVQSENKIDFDFPYNGGSTFTLFVRKEGGENNVFLRCDKCQFIHRYGQANTIKAKFDDGSPVSYSFSEAADGSSDIIFINSANAFIGRLKKAKHLLIGAEFYQEGTKYIDFEVENLKWKH